MLNCTYNPLSSPLFIYVRKSSLARPDVRAFVEYFLENVNNEVAKTGYVATSEEVRSQNLTLLKTTLSEIRPEI
jgi:phosphate transport system substrate-binding protein